MNFQAIVGLGGPEESIARLKYETMVRSLMQCCLVESNIYIIHIRYTSRRTNEQKMPQNGSKF